MAVDKDYCELLHQKISDLNQSECFSDITLLVEGQRFLCHKFLLSAVSPYFHAMFTSNMKESRKKSIQLPFVDVKTFQNVKNYIYSGLINIVSPTEAVALMEAANFLQIDILQKECELYLSSNLDLQNALNAWRIGKKLSSKLEKSAFVYLCRHFTAFVSNGQFLDIDKEELSAILQSEHLILLNEDIATELILSWLEKDSERCKQGLDYVLPLLRLPLTSAEYLYNKLESKHRNIMNNVKLKPYLQEAQNYHQFPARRAGFSSISTRQRPTSLFVDVLILFNGCNEISALTLDTHKWHQLCSVMKNKGKNFAACTFGESTIYVFGGTKESRSLLKYSGLTNRWNSQKALIKFGTLTRHTMIAYDNSVYVFGGITEERIAVREVHRWNTTTDDWESAGFTAKATYDASSAVCNSKILVVGKTRSGGNTEPVVQTYDTTFETTTVIKPAINLTGVESLFGFDKELFVIDNDEVYTVSENMTSLTSFGTVNGLVKPFGPRKIGDKILFLGSQNADLSENGTGKLGKGVMFDLLTRQTKHMVCLDRRLEDLQPLCFKIIIKKRFLGSEGVSDMFA